METIEAILSNTALGAEDSETSRCDEIENLIPTFGWQAIHDAMISILKDDGRGEDQWQIAAEVFWGATLDERKLDADLVIALLYNRLPFDEGSSENNLAWSIASKLKNVDYLSGYDPLKDPGVLSIIEKMGKT